MAEARKVLDWDEQLKLAIDPDFARQKRGKRNKEGEEACSMCGDYCAVKIVGQYLDKPVSPCND
jgi:phosphomethylpyrimidine synthase